MAKNTSRPRRRFVGLSERTKNCLLSAGYRSKPKVMEAIKSGLLHPGARDPVTVNYGKRTHNEVCEWLGIEPCNRIPEPNKKTIAQYTAYLNKHGYSVIKMPYKDLCNAIESTVRSIDELTNDESTDPRDIQDPDHKGDPQCTSLE